MLWPSAVRWLPPRLLLGDRRDITPCWRPLGQTVRIPANRPCRAPPIGSILADVHPELCDLKPEAGGQTAAGNPG